MPRTRETDPTYTTPETGNSRLLTELLGRKATRFMLPLLLAGTAIFGLMGESSSTGPQGRATTTTEKCTAYDSNGSEVVLPAKGAEKDKGITVIFEIPSYTKTEKVHGKTTQVKVAARKVSQTSDANNRVYGLYDGGGKTYTVTYTTPDEAAAHGLTTPPGTPSSIVGNDIRAEVTGVPGHTGELFANAACVDDGSISYDHAMLVLPAH